MVASRAELDRAYQRALLVPVRSWAPLRDYRFRTAKLVTADGWTFVVFIDGGELDYFDHIIDPTGLVLDFDAIAEDHPLYLLPYHLERALERFPLETMGAK